MLPYVITGVIALIVGIAVGLPIGITYRKKVAEAAIGGAELQAKKIIADGLNQAKADAVAAKKEALIEAREEMLRSKNEFEQEIKERRSELSRQERRVQSKEETLDRKTEALEKKDEALHKKLQENEEIREQLLNLKEEARMALQRISGMTAEQARQKLIDDMVEEVRHEQSRRMVELEEEFKDEADEKARNIISLAIQRCAADHVAEITVSTISLPSEDMKGRIIGREGRNIRTIETLTGVDLIIDDTPEAITISSFDPIRREVARLALEKLISDGRIHPTRIEEMVEKARHEVEVSIKKAGDAATFETGIHGLNNELVKLLGRLKYRTSYGQNVLRHSIEVSLLSGIIADELGVDSTLAKRAGLLHDIGKALTAELEGSHVQLGVDTARKYKEGKEVIHAIEAHHGDVEPQTIIAMIVQAADAISAARPGARRENLENYIKRLTKLEEIAKSFDGVEKSFAIQAGREVRIMVKPEIITDDKMPLIARDIVKKIEEELEYPGQIKVNIIRESRSVDYAK
ncbi:MAG: ribonuclease Y [Clostridia bacterium]|nr:ribonuclease Y [Clostridia bacterium]